MGKINDEKLYAPFNKTKTLELDYVQKAKKIAERINKGEEVPVSEMCCTMMYESSLYNTILFIFFTLPIKMIFHNLLSKTYISIIFHNITLFNRKFMLFRANKNRNECTV